MFIGSCDESCYGVKKVWGWCCIGSGFKVLVCFVYGKVCGFI